jgi:hypothetical protein
MQNCCIFSDKTSAKLFAKIKIGATVADSVSYAIVCDFSRQPPQLRSE